MLRRERTLRSIKELSKKYGSGRTLPTSAIRQTNTNTLTYNRHSYGYRIGNWDGKLPRNTDIIETNYNQWFTEMISHTIDLNLVPQAKLITGSEWHCDRIYELYFGTWLYNREYLGNQVYRHYYKTYWLFRPWIMPNRFPNFMQSPIDGNLKISSFHQWINSSTLYFDDYKTYEASDTLYVYSGGSYQQVNYTADFSSLYMTDNTFESSDSLPQHSGTLEMCKIVMTLGDRVNFIVSGEPDINTCLYHLENNTREQAFDNAIQMPTTGGMLFYSHDLALMAYNSKPVSLSIMSPDGSPVPPAYGEVLLTFYK